MTVTRKKRPRDPLQLAKLIGDITTGQVEDREDDGKDPNAAALGRMGGAAKPLGAGEAQLPGNLHHVAERQPTAPSAAGVRQPSRSEEDAGQSRGTGNAQV